MTGESPLVDVKQSARATSIRAEQIDLLPKGRDFTIARHAGAWRATTKAKLGGISIDGASAGENRYIVDGVETTNLQSGVSGKGLIADFVDEVQVKSSGYTAEYGGATGGVINAVTKSGTNNFRGSARFYWYGRRARRASANQSLRLNPVEQRHRRVPGRTRRTTGAASSRASRSAARSAKDKAWFFAAYQPTMTDDDARRLARRRPAAPRRTRSPASIQKDQAHNISANQTAQIGNNLRTRVAYNNSWSKRTGLLPAQTGTDAPTTNYDIDRTSPNWSLSGQADWVVTPNFFVGGASATTSRTSSTTACRASRAPSFSFSNIGLVGSNGVAVPAPYQHPTGFANIATNSSTDARPADPPELPGGLHAVRQPRAASTPSRAACRSTASATTCCRASRATASPSAGASR